VHLPSTAAVRLLAAWQQQRRDLSDRLESLLLHGPTAVDRVSTRADELREAMEQERQAFEAFVALVQEPGHAATPYVDVVAPRSSYPPLRAVHDPSR
jgi:hypothetical protein